jgi:hypothetical protein
MPPLVTPPACRGDERDLDVDRFVELHLDEVDVAQRAIDRVNREVLDHHVQVFAADLHLDDGVLAALALQDGHHVFRRDGERRGGELLAVSDCGDFAGAAKTTSLGLAAGGARLRFECDERAHDGGRLLSRP